MKSCICCGYPMEKIEDFAKSDVNKDYCTYCCNEDGTMHSYDQAVETGTQYYMNLMKLDYEEAKNECINYLKSMPAWK